MFAFREKIPIEVEGFFKQQEVESTIQSNNIEHQFNKQFNMPTGYDYDVEVTSSHHVSNTRASNIVDGCLAILFGCVVLFYMYKCCCTQREISPDLPSRRTIMTEQPSTAPADDRQGHIIQQIKQFNISVDYYTEEGTAASCASSTTIAHIADGCLADFEVEPEQAMSETINDNSDYSIESIEGFVLEIEVSGQSSDILRSINGSKQILEADGEAKDQIDEEADLEGSISDGEIDDMIIGSSEVAKQFIEDLEGEFGGGSNAGTKASQKN
ncbi:hypothetical protein RND71_017578 [Anisodus tanguticus]|uniref:Ycf2 N-terminal domain-containing protein n=1 Tax=Anisodus tanguticus TaxID=243964 RepID=A0AAE1S318_9SOLA|nr:hypothetical protein RND71_017578 [Anisodus tanguticus]